ncbi:Solute carrier family 35 member B1 [Thelohanellus kitauei]|uniref:Solute carrier family 35 member B1 n=1 Tax=Thelohanellus kitauei TaxID=669202 RepID=A0A0C2JAM6_THEKT|nr:Solute carrier family 35 member B1 [Thelohanellus kitauei]
MMLGVILGKRRYTLSKYINVFMITLGVLLFMYNSDSKHTNERKTHIYGTILLMLSLTCDGLTGAVQERIRNSHKIFSSHMMFFLNFWSLFILLILCLISGQFIHFYQFASNNPVILKDVILFAVSSAIGQSFIFKTISTLGPLVCSIITTTRKLFTILLSVILFGNSLTTRQVIGASMVFTGITLDSLRSKSAKH